jgi:hypothetical protein
MLLWHHDRMVTLLAVVVRLVEDALRWLVLLCRSTKSLEAENLFLRRQLAPYIERGVKPRRLDVATRVPKCSCRRWANSSYALTNSLGDCELREAGPGTRMAPHGHCRQVHVLDAGDSRWVRQRTIFSSNTSNSNTWAIDTLLETVGVCRDFAHLMVDRRLVV